MGNPSYITEGQAVLYAALIAFAYTMLAILVNSSIASRRESKKERKVMIERQLSEFYDPILTLVLTNGELFNTIGPLSQIRWDMSYLDVENKKVWDDFVENIIHPNNKRVSQIIEEKLHLISEDDTPKLYIKFIVHAEAYKIFTQRPFEAYTSNFTFPKGFVENIKTNHEKLLMNIRRD